MNKFKKLTAAAVSTVMAGTMAIGLAACGPKDNVNNVDLDNLFNQSVVNSDGTLNYDAYKRDTPVTLNLSVGYNSKTTSTSYLDIGDEITLPDGVTYSQGDFKPAWVQMGKDLNITWSDSYTGQATSGNLSNLLTTNQTGSSNAKLYAATDIFTTDLSEAVKYVQAGSADILNLADYLEYMPNFSNFLSENPVVYLSLLQEGMNTTTGAGQAIYVAPYFDGNDDIERYCLIRRDWAEKLLNGSSTLSGSTAFSASCASSTSVQAYMGSTNYNIESLNEDGSAKITITKNYTNVVTQLGTAGSALKTAYEAITNGVAYSGTSGNIIDVMNAALKVNAGATGAQLVDLYRAYIDACYQKDGQAYFTANKRANLFNGYDACWDVDDLVAILRCVKTNAATLLDKAIAKSDEIGGIMPRSGQNDRTPDMVRLACQLYGVRGADSRLEYTYIDNDGNIKDARASSEIYDACANLNLLKQEGLVADYSSQSGFSGTSGMVTVSSKKYEYFMMYDYSQTQTLNGFYAEDSSVTGVDVPDDYDFAPVITPVAKWDVDGDGDHTDLMRFTESWRSVKTSGIALNGSLKKDADKLKAAIQFIDYLYSEDGQIISTYGPMAESADGKGGFWYDEQASAAQISAGEYFTYKGVKYAGTEYKGNYTPTITTAVYDSFKGKTVSGWTVTSNDAVTKAKLSFTNYARFLIGSTLPVGVKDQSFENQLTSKMGQDGAGIVGTALAAGVVKGMSLKVDSNNYWYTCVPTGLPVDAQDQTDILDGSSHQNFKYLTGTAKDSSNKNFFSIFNWIILNGTSSTFKQQDVTVDYSSIQALLDYQLSGTTSISALASSRQTVFNRAWSTAKEYWDYLSK